MSTFEEETAAWAKGVQDKAKDLAAKAGVSLIGLNRYGCVPGSKCRCPRSFSTCSAWAALERLAAEAQS